MLFLEARSGDEEVVRLWGEDIETSTIPNRLAPGLDLVWSDRPDAPTDLRAFLEEAQRRAVAGLEDLGGEDGFIPAAQWTPTGRELLLEHLQVEVDSLIGGVKTAEIWAGFGGVTATEAITELVATGMLIKLRSVGAFLVLPPSKHEDELTAADFFAVGEWEAARTDAIAGNLLSNQTLVHKQIAHLTITRPFPEETWVYRPSSFYDLVLEQITLLEDFTQAVDPRLLPEWWGDWVSGLRQRLLPDGV